MKFNFGKQTAVFQNRCTREASIQNFFETCLDLFFLIKLLFLECFESHEKLNVLEQLLEEYTHPRRRGELNSYFITYREEARAAAVVD